MRIQCTRIIQILNKHYHERDKIKRWERKWDTRNINRNEKKNKTREMDKDKTSLQMTQEHQGKWMVVVCDDDY